MAPGRVQVTREVRETVRIPGGHGRDQTGGNSLPSEMTSVFLGASAAEIRRPQAFIR
jgi:hypothetical protein